MICQTSLTNYLVVVMGEDSLSGVLILALLERVCVHKFW